MYSEIKDTLDFITSQCRLQPVLGLVLGSGLGAYADTFRNRTAIPFADLPHFPSSTIPGHSGNLVLGNAEGVPVVALQGRVHLYEGYSISEVAFPSRILGALGIRRLIVTNAAGAVNTAFKPGELMLISDHINLMGTNPLIGPNLAELGPRFPDMSDAYDGAMREMARAVAGGLGITLREGVYAGVCGPSYETPAEIRMLRTLGADAVGMSTVPEVIAANHMEIPVLGISCITNMAAGIQPQKLTHQEVIDTTAIARKQFDALLRAIIPRLATND